MVDLGCGRSNQEGVILRYLITGGAGFLGSHLARKLLDDGHEVLVADNFYTGQKSNIQPLFTNSNFEFIRHDITFPLFVEVDGIYNLACPASPIQYQKFPVQTTKTSVLGAINMLGLAKRLGIRIFQASTSEIYGDPEISPQVESYWGNVNPIGIRSCYDEGKRVAETLFFDYQRQYSLDIRVARIFNTYGPNMDPNDGRVVSNFIMQALTDKPITIFGDGSQTRSFCYVDDLIDGITKLMNCENVTTPVNLGNTNFFTMNELADLVIAITGSSSKKKFLPLPEDDPKVRQPDTTLAKNLLNWSATTELESGLKKTIDYFEGLLSKGDIHG
jgi:UDP-glucuronate decarboxylase